MHNSVCVCVCVFFVYVTILCPQLQEEERTNERQEPRLKKKKKKTHLRLRSYLMLKVSIITHWLSPCENTMWKMSFHKHGLWGNITTLCRSVHVPAFWLCGSRHRQYISLKMFLKVEGIWREDGCVWNEVGGKVVKRTGVTAHPCGWNSAMVKYKYTVYMELTSSEAGLCCVFNLHLCVSLMKNIYIWNTVVVIM